ncbi:hypothetical protein B9479_002363 [Cryptococcus floricola]|uniref:RNA polymerase II subunit B1 CTD phosphatase RPAP2 homolog n=1 Tax=Cryptococcus floricola TaxID=2591691 RepID=A0A5D3B1D7_9TREE|nr:hypothetical protein B9479_002363 [Cryptococcus floricola]
MPIAIPAQKPQASTSGPAPTSSAAPVQFPRNPARLAVATRDTPSGPSSRPVSSPRRVSQPTPVPADDSSTSQIGEPSEAALREDAETLKRARVRKAQLQKKVERWMDLLSEDTVEREAFKKAAAHLTPPQYHEILHERHLNSLCSYPLCPNPPTAPYSSRRKFIISTSKRSIDPASGNEHEGFCGKKCTARSKWMERQLRGEAVWLRDLKGLGGEGGGVELLEEVEERGEVPSLDDVVGRRGSEVSANAEETAPAPAVLRPQQVIAPAKQPLPADAAQVKPGTSAVTALIDSLVIHERPVSAPGAPQTAKQVPVAQPSPLPLPLPTSVKSSRALNAREQRRDQASLITPPATLTRSVLSAAQSVSSSLPAASGGADSSKSSTPGGKNSNRGGPGQESEEEESDEESDWEKEMKFGPEDDEMRALFEEAEKAREMALDGEGAVKEEAE